jgi:hypothetical protein
MDADLLNIEVERYSGTSGGAARKDVTRSEQTGASLFTTNVNFRRRWMGSL